MLRAPLLVMLAALPPASVRLPGAHAPIDARVASSIDSIDLRGLQPEQAAEKGPLLPPHSTARTPPSATR